MALIHTVALQRMLLAVGIVLVLATVTGQALAIAQRRGGHVSETVQNLNARVNAWWVMCLIFAIALLTGGVGSVILFFFVSILALREFLTITPTHPADHDALLWIYFVVAPLQYILVYVQWYGFFSIMIPVYAALLVPMLLVLGGDTRGYLQRAAATQLAMLLCVYCISYAPALVELSPPGFAHRGAMLLLYLVVVVQGSDVAQYICGKLFGKHRIAPTISPNKTVEGFVGGMLFATGLGAAIFWITPFSPFYSACMGLMIGILGFGGGLVMSAVKRDQGVKDFGHLISGHGGILDRMDSLAFSAPIFFQITRFVFHGGPF